MKLLPGRSSRSVYSRADTLNLKKDPEFLKTMNRDLVIKAGMNSRFTKGSIPFNKGIKGNPAHPNAVASLFKKGNLPHNYVPVGTERITKDGYKEVKIEDPRTWVLKHRYIYEQHHKTIIPKTHIVIFLDGNKLNCDIDNLALISKRDNIERNSGSVNLSDTYLANMVCGKFNKEIKEEVLENKELLNLKRQQLQLNRAIKNKHNDTGRDKRTTEGNEG